MGSIRRCDPADLQTRYDCEVFVETGTYRGDGVQAVRLLPFRQIHTIELQLEFHDAARERFKDDKRVECWLGPSHEMLVGVLHMERETDSILYWLDAHLPDFYPEWEESEPEKVTRFPLEEELEVICRMRDVSKDVFVMDDLRIYEKGPYSSGNCHERWTCPGIGFAERLLGDTHDLERRYEDEGYLVATPKVG